MSFMNKIEKIMGLKDPEFDEEFDDELEEEQEDEKEEGRIAVEPFVNNNKKPNKIVSINTASSSKVVISRPKSYEESQVIVDNLKSRKIIIVNLSNVENKEGQRILDFLIGAIYALEGNLQSVDDSVFILTPSNVEVSNELKNELSSKGIFGNFK